MDVYHSPSLDVVLVEQVSGLFVVLDGDTTSAVFTLPGDAVQLLDPDDGKVAVLDEVRAALADVTMSAKARRAVADALDELTPDGAM